MRDAIHDEQLKTLQYNPDRRIRCLIESPRPMTELARALLHFGMRGLTIDFRTGFILKLDKVCVNLHLGRLMVPGCTLK